jgi:hypothetical protein
MRKLVAIIVGISLIQLTPSASSDRIIVELSPSTPASAPFVSAEAALLRAATTKEADKAIAKGAVDIDSLNPGYKNRLGSGRIDMLRHFRA